MADLPSGVVASGAGDAAWRRPRNHTRKREAEDAEVAATTRPWWVAARAMAACGRVARLWVREPHWSGERIGQDPYVSVYVKGALNK